MRYENDKVIISPLDKYLLFEKPYGDWIVDLEVNQYNSHGAFPINAADIDGFIDDIQEKRILAWNIFTTGNFYIGNTTIQSIDWINRSAEIAIMIGDKNYWGKGIGEATCRLLLHHGFYKLNLHRIWLGTLNINYGMKRIAERIGMVMEGRKRGAVIWNRTYHDIICYSILSEEMKEKNEQKDSDQ